VKYVCVLDVCTLLLCDAHVCRSSHCVTHNTWLDLCVFRSMLCFSHYLWQRFMIHISSYVIQKFCAIIIYYLIAMLRYNAFEELNWWPKCSIFVYKIFQYYKTEVSLFNMFVNIENVSWKCYKSVVRFELLG